MNAELMQDVLIVAERLGWVFIHSLWQGCAVAAIVAGGLWFTRHRSAALRHLLCFAGIVAMVFLLIGTGMRAIPRDRAVLAAQTARSMTLREAQPVATVPALAIETPGEAAEFGRTPIHTPAIAAAPGSLAGNFGTHPADWSAMITPYLPWISGIWLAGVLFLTLRHVGGWWTVRSIRSEASSSLPAYVTEATREFCHRMGLRRTLPVMASHRIQAPLLAGVLKPIILFPAGLATGLRPCDVDAIIAHELAHFVRRDTWTNLLQVIAETILFYHPAIWWMGHRARIERENAADDLAVAAMHEDRASYAGALARLAELQYETQTLTLAASDGSLVSRLHRLLKQPEKPEGSSAGWLLGIILLSVCIAAVPLRAQDGAKVIKVAAGESLQNAIDAAEPGSTLELGAGEWKERIVIAKPLTLKGAGWEKTVIKPDQPAPGVTQEARAAFRKQYGGQNSQEAIDRLRREWAEKFAPPTVFVKNAAKVSLRGLRIGGIAPANEDDAGDDPLVTFSAAQAEIEDCAVVGPYGNGVNVTERSVVEIRRSLISALWRMGVAVQGTGSTQDKASTLRLAESEIRSVYLYGLSIGHGCNDTVIERCRISGTAWHGIRYDDASPTIIGNAIFKHARCGIYASGQTKATVRENLFWRNEMDGISCWFNNSDVIEENTFVENLRESLAVLGNSKPTARRNLFASSPIGVSCSSIATRNGEPSAVGQPVLADNWYWSTPVTVGKPDAEKDPALPKTGADPMFVNTGEQDFTLAADSPVRTAKIGVAEPLSVKGPWPLLAEEKAMIPEDDTYDSRYWGKAGSKKSKTAETASRKAFEDAKTWVADAFQLDDKAKRGAAIEKVRVAMNSDDAGEARTGLTAFSQLGPIEFDKASFRPLVRKLVRSNDVATRSSAAGAFTLTGAEPEDLPVIYALADDESAEVRDRLAFVIFRVNNGDLTSKGASDAILKLIRKMPADPRSIAHAIWGAKLSPEIEAKVLEICKDVPYAQGPGYDFFYGTLSTQANKSEASVKRLIELLAHEDTTNIAGRSAWGLQQGVAPAQYPMLADAMIKVIEARSDGYLRNNALRCLRQYGTSAQAPALQAVLAKPGVTGEFRKEIEAALAEIEARK